MLAVGMSREEATKWVARYPRAISIAAVNGPNSITLSGDAAVLAEIDKALNAADVFSRALRVDVPYHSPKMEQLEAELLECLRDIRPRPASTPFFSTVTGTALEGSELDARYWYRNVRQPVLFHDTIARLVEAGHQAIPRDRCTSHPETRHRPVPAREVVGGRRRCARCGGTIASERRCSDRSAGCIRLAPRSTGGSFIRPRRRRSSCRAIRFSPTFIGGNPSRRVGCGWASPVHPLLGNRLEVSKPSWSATLDTAELELSRRPPDRRLDHLSGRGICRDGARGGPRDFRVRPLRRGGHRIPEILGTRSGRSAPWRRWCSTRRRANSRSMLAPMLLKIRWDVHARGCVRQSNGADAGERRHRRHSPALSRDVRSRGVQPADLLNVATITARRSKASRGYGGATGRFSPRSTSPSSLSDAAVRLSIASRQFSTPAFQTLLPILWTELAET